MMDLTCPMPGCRGSDYGGGSSLASDFYVVYETYSVPDPGGNSPDDGTSQSWRVECQRGHVVLTCEDTPYGCEDQRCMEPEHPDNRCGHSTDEVDSDEHRTFRAADYVILAERVERLMVVLAATEGQPLEWIRSWATSQQRT